MRQRHPQGHNRPVSHGSGFYRDRSYEFGGKPKGSETFRAIRNVVPGARCPKCGWRMAKRVNSIDKTEFLGCTMYPQCKGTAPMPREVAHD